MFSTKSKGWNLTTLSGDTIRGVVEEAMYDGRIQDGGPQQSVEEQIRAKTSGKSRADKIQALLKVFKMTVQNAEHAEEFRDVLDDAAERT
ncbi:hypothetical protein D9611_000587 [Ephemerocybe angulata]|uniref:Uncharacterized protein n=1 Tax=Ephemerocybe angulata TaxID=980116 RepID=A0A8H5BN04_9AGAR|nr:hypothetical protein D9611_000587 [Tulosesus angulatus]